MEYTIVLGIGAVIDLLAGDPHWLWHPVQGMGKLIEISEYILRKLFRLPEETEAGRIRKQIAGGILAVAVPAASVGITVLLLLLCERICPWLKYAAETWICYQMLALRSLRTESMRVKNALESKGLEAGRKAVSWIVGRDTENLTREGVIRAAVETVAENTSDGVIAPLFYMLLFGPVGGVAYKAVNTMDSMIGYRNDRYRYFGTCAARLDDVLNYIPARLSALAMIAAAYMLRMDGKNAWKIFKRDRYCHASPNSAQTEAVCAGALDVRLAGNASYFGVVHEKPYIGDALREIEPEDILRANRLAYGTAFLIWILGTILRLAILTIG